jgi:hypothetical protein
LNDLGIDGNPSMIHCLFVAEEFEAEISANGSVVTGRFYHVRSKLRGQTKGVSNSSGFGGRLVSPPVKNGFTKKSDSRPRTGWNCWRRTKALKLDQA